MAWRNLLTADEAAMRYQVDSSEEFFKHPMVRKFIKDKEIDKAYQFYRKAHATGVPGRFTEALYSSGVDPFKYLKEDFLPEGMFCGLDRDLIDIPEKFNAAGVRVFDFVNVHTLIIENQSFLFNPNDDVFTCAYICNLYISPFTLSNIECSDWFTNQNQPINIYLRHATDYEMEDVHTRLIDQVNPIFPKLNPKLVSLYKG